MWREATGAKRSLQAASTVGALHCDRAAGRRVGRVCFGRGREMAFTWGVSLDTVFVMGVGVCRTSFTI